MNQIIPIWTESLRSTVMAARSTLNAIADNDLTVIDEIQRLQNSMDMRVSGPGELARLSTSEKKQLKTRLMLRSACGGR